MIATQDLRQSGVDPKGLSPVSLAFVGDGVFELMVREKLLERGSMPANRLHRLSVKQVRATAQAAAYHRLSEELDEEELRILKRGRNAATSRVPKNCTPEQYHKATAVEALLGYLYLKGDLARLRQLFGLIEQVQQPTDAQE